MSSLVSTLPSPILFLVLIALSCLLPFTASSSTASLCFVTYSLPGSPDYPWSAAYSLQVTYDPTPVSAYGSQAVPLLSANGTRTFTNRFGISTSLTLSLLTGTSAYIHLGTAIPFDVSGVSFSVASPTQQPGAGPTLSTSTFLLYNSSNTVLESGSYVIDTVGQAWLSSIPGFVNQSIAASNVNSLAVSYATCQAPLTFVNGLRSPTQPSVSNGATALTFIYTISDGATYQVQGNLSITTNSAFANAHDALGNPYQSITGVTGTRLYTYLPTGATLLSTITGLASTSIGSPTPSQRFYPYSLLSSSPGVFSINTAPFLDAAGLEYQISPAAPALGSPLSGATSAYVQVKVSFPPAGSAVLSEMNAITSPSLVLQQQSYTLGAANTGAGGSTGVAGGSTGGSPGASTGGGGGVSSQNATQWCIGLTDSTSCLNALLLSNAGTVIVVPFPSASYIISSVIAVPASTTFDCNGCTISLLNNPSHGWYDYMMCIGSSTTLRNATLTSPYPTLGLCIYSYSANIEVASVNFVHLPGQNYGYEWGTAINFGGNISSVNIHDSTFKQVGYGVLMNNQFITAVTVSHCVFNNNSADAVALNSPVLLNQQYAWFSHVWSINNVTIINNVITNIRNDVDESQGFCISSAGGQYVLIANNYISGCSWQAIHLEDLSSWISIINNTIDNVYGNTAVAWANTLDGVWIYKSQEVLVQNNTFSRIATSCVQVVNADRVCFLDENLPTYEFDGIFVPWFYQTSHDINITGNNFISWGTDGGTHSTAIQVGSTPGESDAITRLTNNHYLGGTNTTWAYCGCVHGLTLTNLIVNEPQFSGTGCSGSVYTAASCNVAITHCPGS